MSPLGCMILLLGLVQVSYSALLEFALFLVAAALEEVLQLQPDLAEAKKHLGTLYFHLERYAEAADMFQSYLEVEYVHLTEIFLTYSHYLEGDLDNALDVLQAMPQQYKGELSCILMLGGLFLDMGCFQSR